MRHLGSLVTGLIAVPAIWLLLAIGQPRTMATIDGWVAKDQFDTVGLIGPIAYLAAAGLIAGLIACLRVSPLGPTIAGLAFGGLYAALFVTPLRVVEAIPDQLDLGIVEARLREPVDNGTLAMLSALLLIALWSPARWRRWPSGRPAQAPAPALASEPATPGVHVLGPGDATTALDGPADSEGAPELPGSPPPAWPQPAEQSATPTPTDAPAETEPPAAAGASSVVPGTAAAKRPSTLAD